ncbi:hypothetical protein [Streptomyces sp. NPDC006879]|uniref:hypothetical protein n=1 Tax=Streptomyces sp. NPDC006879 TaxID=3364767 RepID=UPI0036B42837
MDSAPFAPGMRLLDLMPPEAADQLRHQVSTSEGGWQLEMPPFEELGLSSSLDGLDSGQLEVLRARATPHPFGTYTQRLSTPAELGFGVDRVLISCRDFTALLDEGVPMLAFLNQPPWRRFDLPTGHWPMLSAPSELANILDAVVS